MNLPKFRSAMARYWHRWPPGVASRRDPLLFFLTDTTMPCAFCRARKPIDLGDDSEYLILAQEVPIALN